LAEIDFLYIVSPNLAYHISPKGKGFTCTILHCYCTYSC